MSSSNLRKTPKPRWENSNDWSKTLKGTYSIILIGNWREAKDTRHDMLEYLSTIGEHHEGDKWKRRIKVHGNPIKNFPDEQYNQNFAILDWARKDWGMGQLLC